MTDRELLEAAAKAAAVGEIEQYAEDGWLRRDTGEKWNPLADDGDALRLAVKLRMQVQINEASVVVGWNWSDFESANPVYEYPETEQDADYNWRHVAHDAATRRCIVRAAAEIGATIEAGR